MRHPFSLILLALLPACSQSYQTSSGGDYLAARSFAGVEPILNTQSEEDDHPTLASLAAVEPHLAFPARIGIARVVNGVLTLAPAEEAEVWADLIGNTRGFGEFVPLSPLVADLVGASTRNFGLQEARAMGARQHLDYILLVDVTGSGGVAEAAFVDVRNGYPYATVQAALAGAEDPGYGWSRRSQRRADQARLELTQVLMPEVSAMLTGLAARAQ